MDKVLEPLLTPWKIGKVQIKNRFVMTSMGGTNLFGWMEHHHFDKWGAMFIYEVAKHDCGLVLPGCQPVWNPMFGSWLYKNKKMYKDLEVWLEEFHKTGAKIFIQLTAGFGRSFTISPMMEKLYTNKVLRKLSKPVMDLDKITASASPAPNRWSDKVPSRELTVKEIKEYVAAFGKTSKLLMDAGVDGVEVHAVHEGYLLDQFTLDYVNKRTDEYGGSLENKYRFATEIVQEIKKACGDNFPVSLRYSVESKTKGFRSGALPGEDYKEAGRDFSESIKAIKLLDDAGYDMFNCDNGTYDAWYWSHPPIYMPENCNLKEAQDISRYTKKPIVCAGRINVEEASKSIKEGKITAAGFARNFLSDQAWITKLIEGRKEDIKPCILCHNGCFNMCSYKGVPNDQKLSDSLHLARCAVNAETMQWDRHFIIPTKVSRRIHIIGGGIAGMEAALRLKQKGHIPIIYEKNNYLGGVFVAASKESYKQPLRDLLEWYKKQIKDNDIKVKLKREIKQTDAKNFKGEPIVVATGAKPTYYPDIPGFQKGIEASKFLLENPKIGKRVVIVGGGITGSEIAYELAMQGKHVEIIEAEDDLIKQTGVCLANSSYLREWFKLHDIKVHLECKLREIRDDSVIYTNINDKANKIMCSAVITSMGYVPNPLFTLGKNTYVIGDCKKVGNLRTVIWDAYRLAMKI